MSKRLNHFKAEQLTDFVYVWDEAIIMLIFLDLLF